jgi:hypothetical protein
MTAPWNSSWPCQPGATGNSTACWPNSINTPARPATAEVVGELAWQGFRLIVAHRPEVAREQGTARDERIAALEADAARWAGKLDGQEEGQAFRGKKLSDAGTTARFYKAVSDAHLANIIKVDLSAQVFTYDIDERALNRARMMDGKLILVSNMPDHTPAEIVEPLQGPGGYRAGFPGAQERDRDRAGVPPLARRGFAPMP